jgi:outer membrane biosynthesis protein TonB
VFRVSGGRGSRRVGVEARREPRPPETRKSDWLESAEVASVSRLSLWAPFGLLYIVVAVGIVHFEGGAYRRGLRERRKALALDVKSVETPEVKPEAVSPSMTTPTPSSLPPEEVKPPEPLPADEPKPPVVAHVETRHVPTPKPRVPAGAGKPKAGGRPATLPADAKEPVVKLPPQHSQPFRRRRDRARQLSPRRHPGQPRRRPGKPAAPECLRGCATDH